MTKQQQSIIDSLRAEFERINASSNTRKGFNLINVASLQEETRANKEWKQLSEEDQKAWRKTAFTEMWRIIYELEQDLPDYVQIEHYGQHISKHDMPCLQIRHESVSCYAHHESLVNIEVRAITERKANEYGLREEFGTHLEYIPYPIDTSKHNTYGRGYSTIQEAVNDKCFQDALRKRVIR
jgi:hypothetical protein